MRTPTKYSRFQVGERRFFMMSFGMRAHVGPACPPRGVVEGLPDLPGKARDRGNVAATCGKEKAASVTLNRF
jgi:hypothetical protein